MQTPFENGTWVGHISKSVNKMKAEFDRAFGGYMAYWAGRMHRPPPPTAQSENSRGPVAAPALFLDMEPSNAWFDGNGVVHRGTAARVWVTARGLAGDVHEAIQDLSKVGLGQTASSTS
jgi:hypothetical protein